MRRIEKVGPDGEVVSFILEFDSKWERDEYFAHLMQDALREHHGKLRMLLQMKADSIIKDKEAAER